MCVCFAVCACVHKVRGQPWASWSYLFLCSGSFIGTAIRLDWLAVSPGIPLSLCLPCLDYKSMSSLLRTYVSSGAWTQCSLLEKKTSCWLNHTVIVPKLWTQQLLMQFKFLLFNYWFAVKYRADKLNPWERPFHVCFSLIDSCSLKLWHYLLKSLLLIIANIKLLQLCIVLDWNNGSGVWPP